MMFAQPIRISARSTDPTNNHTSTVDTIRQMGPLADASSNHPLVLQAVQIATSNLYQADYRDLAEAIWHYIHTHITFAVDEATMEKMGIPTSNPTKELLITPPTLLAMAQPTGDCDDFSMLARAMLRTVGIKMSFITIKADRSEPSKWSHVYGKAYWPGGNMPFDCSHGEWPGWESPVYWERREWA